MGEPRGSSAVIQLVCRDDRELRRIERTIAFIENDRPSGSLRRDCLLEALKNERDELLRIAGRKGRVSEPRRLSA
jgi:hypothetical protein